MKQKLIFVIFFFTSLVICSDETSGKEKHVPQFLDSEFTPNTESDPSAFDLVNNSEEADQGKNQDALTTTDKLASMLINNIPNLKLKGALKEYIKIISPATYKKYDGEIGTENTGINSYFEYKFRSNQCFESAAIEFYKEVSSTLNSKTKCEANEQSDYGCIKNRASIKDRVGKASKNYLDEAWLLRIALKHSKGNPEVALELIGMCGHDDVMQGNYLYIDKTAGAKFKNKQEILTLKQQQTQLTEQLKNNDNKLDAQAKADLAQQNSTLDQQIKKIASAEGRNNAINCPMQASDYYLPGSLSASADIAPDLIARIVNIQTNKQKDNIFIPAKHYHVYGSALLGCKMVISGLSAEAAVTVQKQAARIYRGLRMCEHVTKIQQKRKQLSLDLNLIKNNDATEIESKILEIWKSVIKSGAICVKDAPTPKGASPVKQTGNIQQCRLLSQFGIIELKSTEQTIAQKKIRNNLKSFDAAILYNRWYFGGGTIFSKDIPCTDLRYKGPSDLMNPNGGPIGKLAKPKDWSSERYEYASNELATWDVDFEWTIAQHETGARFGAKLCSETKIKQNSFNEPGCTNTQLYYGSSGQTEGGYIKAVDSKNAQ